jgi:hypothetical protein
LKRTVNSLQNGTLVVMMEAAVGVGAKTVMPMVNAAVVKNISAKEVREAKDS